MIVWCFDPGETTGVFMSDGLTDYRAQIEYPQIFSWTYSMLEDADVRDRLPETIIVERVNIFDSRASRARKNLQPTLDVQGYLTGIAHLYAVPVVLQWNRDKNKVSDTDLDLHGILMKPKTKWRHTNDAARHYVYWSNRKKEA